MNAFNKTINSIKNYNINYLFTKENIGEKIHDNLSDDDICC